MISVYEKRFRLLKAVSVAVTALILVSVLSAAGAEWKPYAKSLDMGMEYLYSPESIDNRSADMVKVWTKIIIISQERKDSHVQKRKASRLSTEGYEDYEYSLYLVEFNCKDRMHSRLSYKDYSQDLSVLDSYDYNSPLWKPVVPESSAEQLFNIVCPVKHAGE